MAVILHFKISADICTFITLRRRPRKPAYNPLAPIRTKVTMKIPVIKRQHWTKKVAGLIVALTILAFVSIFTSDAIESIGIKANYVTLILACSVAILGGFLNLKKGHDVIGHLLLTKDNSLRLQIPAGSTDLNDSNVINLDINNYEGQLRGSFLWMMFSRSKMFPHNDGLGNFIYIKNGDNTSKLEILIETEYIYNQLKKIKHQ